MPYSPAFQFYPGEYLSDKNTMPMTTEEIGAYDLLMWVCWEEDGLADDMEELADIARMPVEKFTPSWNRRIKKCFRWDDKKKLFFHPRQEKEIKKQKAWRKEKSDAGKAGAAKRWKETSKSDSTAIAPPYDRIATNGSSSPSPTSFSISDLKRWMKSAHAHATKSGLDPRLVEIAVLETWIRRGEDATPIKSFNYFFPEIERVCAASDISGTFIDDILQRRREQAGLLESAKA